MKQAIDVGTITEHADTSLVLAQLADSADQRTQPSRVDELDLGEIDDQPRLIGNVGEGLPKLSHRVGIELAHRAQHDEVRIFCLFNNDLKHRGMVSP